MATPLLAAAAGAVALPLLAVTVFLGSGAADPPTVGGTVCTVVTDPAEPGQTDPGTTTLTGEQVENARVIIATAQALGLPQQAAIIGIMTSHQESKLLVLSNPAVPASLDYPHHGAGTDQDSVGTFQQRPSMGWGTVAQLMDPSYAATEFLQTLAGIPGWDAMPLWQSAQAVQSSADGTLYAQWEPLAGAVTKALWGGTTGSLQCTSAGPVTGPGGSFPPEACSVRPDPTTRRGCLTPRMLNVATQLMAQGWDISCWDEHAWNPSSDHPEGKACDVFPGRGGVFPTAAEKARGDALAASLQATAAQTGINLLIWYGRDWSPGREWDSYGGGGIYDPSSPTGGHFDHMHISVH